VTSKVYVVTDLGPGDGGKGGVVHKISHMMHVHTILKAGGGQGSHGVQTSGGERFAFSHWGCGTLEAVKTHISDQMIIIPEGILNEGTLLQRRHGIDDPYSLLTADERAVCATPFDQLTSRLTELSRGVSPRGTVGTGAGVAYRSFRRLPSLSILAGDLKASDLKDRLAAIRDDTREQLLPILEGEFLAADEEEARTIAQYLSEDGFLNHAFDILRETGKLLHVVSQDYLGEVVLRRPGVAIVETSHGILTDRHYGFHPHTSAIRTLSHFRRDIFDNAGYMGEIVNLGVFRAYAIRHGAGPMPTHDPALGEHLLPGSSKGENRYQGAVRVGPLDLVALKYAIEVCGGPQAFDGLAVTWFDQIQSNGVWQSCHAYDNANPDYFLSPNRIKVSQEIGTDHIQYQRGLGHALTECVPQLQTVPIDANSSRDKLYELVNTTLQASLDVPVRMVSFGPTEQDKLCK
jgi:adenylosuccinate synthase